MNEMERLLNKIERRLGTKVLNLPEQIQKPTWANIIIEDTIPTFSRYFPNRIRHRIDTSKHDSQGYFYLDSGLPDNIRILGVRDIAWDEFGSEGSAYQQNLGYGAYDFFGSTYGIEDVMGLQMRADMTSLFNNGIYIDFIPPNKIKLVSTTGANVSQTMTGFPVDILVEHAPNLSTISPTKMETFEALALSDVAIYLYEYLKHFEGLETVFANVDLKLDSIKEKADNRENIIQKLEDGYVSSANDNQPIIMTI